MLKRLIEFFKKPSVAVTTQEIKKEKNVMPTWIKSIMMKILAIMPIYSILDLIITWLEEKAAKTPTQWDDTACEFLRAAIEILKNKDFPTANDLIKYPEIK